MADVPEGITLDAPVPEGITLDPQPAATPPAPPGITLVGEAPALETESWLGSTAVGRVLKATGQGFREGFGDDNIGLSIETVETLQGANILPDVEKSIFDPIKTFNQALILPAAAGLDATVRGLVGVIHGGAAAIGQTALELGEDQGMSKRLERDVLALADVVGIATGTAPVSGARRVAQQARRTEAEAQRARIARAAAERPKAPNDPLPPSPEEAVVDKAGNINLDRINAPEDIKDVIRQAAEQGGEFTEARRGVISLEQTEDLADALGMTPSQLLERNVGQAFNAEQAVAARNLLVQSADNVFMLSRKAKGGSEEDLLAFQQAVTRHMAIQEQVAGMTAEAGRALSSFRILAQSTREAQDLGEVIAQFGGRENIEDVADMLGKLNSPQQVSKFLQDSRKATTGDMLIEAWINALLSGPQTHVVNALSNTAVALWTLPETAIAAGIGGVRRLAGSTDERVLFGEVGARMFGFLAGAKDGVVAGWKTFRTEVPSDGLSKLEQPRPRAIPSKTITIGGRQIEIGGKQVRIPGRLLMAGDEIFKAMGYRQELAARAYRKASEEGLRGDSFINRVYELMENPTKAMVKAAQENADYQTFTKQLGRVGRSVQGISNSHPAAKVVVPFVKTPTNILKFTGERTPLAVFSPAVRKELRGESGPVARDTMMARIVAGSAVGAATVSMAASGHITGSGPDDPRQRAVDYLNGMPPNSIRLGDWYYSYGRLEPLGTLLGVAASMYEVSQAAKDVELEDVAALVIGAVSKNLVDKTWLQGVSDLIEAINDPDRFAPAYIRKLAGTAVPTGVAQAARTMDPELKDARSILDVIKSRTPVLSREVKARRDIWGEPIVTQGGLGPDALTPIYMMRVNNDPVNQELRRLKIWPAPLGRKVRGVELTEQQYDDYQRIAGRLSKQVLDNIVKQPGWQQLPEFARVDILTKSLVQAREAGRNLFLLRNPEIMREAVKLKTDRIAPPAAE